jgi:hypothetical protein
MEQYEVMLAQTASDVAKEPALTSIIQEIAVLEQIVPSIKVTDEATEATASEARARAKTCVKDMEAMRKMQKAPYKKVADTIDSLYRPLKQSCARMVELLDEQIAPFKRAKIEAAYKAQAKAMQEAIEAKEAGESVPPPAEVSPSATSKTESGQTYIRKVKKVEVVDPVKLVKAAIDNRNQVPFDVIMVNETKLRQVAIGQTYKPKQWAKYGVRVYEEDEVATRT